MEPYNIVLLIVFGLGLFYIIKLNIVFNSLLNAGAIVTYVKVSAISANERGRLSDEDLDYVLGKLEIESVVRDVWFCFLCPWVWSTKQCFRKGNFKKIF